MAPNQKRVTRSSAAAAVKESNHTGDAERTSDDSEKGVEKSVEDDVRMEDNEDKDSEDEEHVENEEEEESNVDEDSEESSNGTEEEDDDEDGVVQGKEGTIKPDVLNEGYKSVKSFRLVIQTDDEGDVVLKLREGLDIWIGYHGKKTRKNKEDRAYARIAGVFLGPRFSEEDQRSCVLKICWYYKQEEVDKSRMKTKEKKFLKTMVKPERLASNHFQFISAKSVLDEAIGLSVDDANGFNHPIPLKAWYYRARYDPIKNIITGIWKCKCCDQPYNSRTTEQRFCIECRQWRCTKKLSRTKGEKAATKMADISHPNKIVKKFAIMPIFRGGIAGTDESWAMGGNGFARILAQEWLEGGIDSLPASWMDELNGNLDDNDGEIGNLVLYCAGREFEWRKCPGCKTAI